MISSLASTAKTTPCTPAMPATPAAAAAPKDQVAPLDVFPMANDSLKPGGRAGINKPFKTKDAEGT